MADIPPSALEPQLQQFVANARTALRQGQPDYILALGEPLLAAAPTCVEVRRVVRAAQRQRLQARPALLARLSNVTAALRLLRVSRGGSAMERFAAAEKILRNAPMNLAALKVQARAASELGWLETAVYLWQEVRQAAPEDRVGLLALGDAWLAAGCREETLRLAESWLQSHPHDAEVEALLRRASLAQTLARGNWEGTGDFREKLWQDDPRAPG